MTIGTRIKELRQKCNYSQEYVAEQLDISRQAVSKWENDITSPDTNNLIMLAKLYNCSVEYIAVGNEQSNDENDTAVKNTAKSCKVKKITIAIISALAVLVLSLAFYIYTRPVDWDAMACSGGYATYLFDKYQEDLVELFYDSCTEKNRITDVTALKGTHDATWKDRTIYMHFDIRYTHADEGIVVRKVTFVGRRIWIETFYWTGVWVIN